MQYFAILLFFNIVFSSKNLKGSVTLIQENQEMVNELDELGLFDEGAENLLIETFDRNGKVEEEGQNHLQAQEIDLLQRKQIEENPHRSGQKQKNNKKEFIRGKPEQNQVLCQSYENQLQDDDEDQMMDENQMVDEAQLEFDQDEMFDDEIMDEQGLREAPVQYQQLRQEKPKKASKKKQVAEDEEEQEDAEQEAEQEDEIEQAPKRRRRRREPIDDYRRIRDPLEDRYDYWRNPFLNRYDPYGRERSYRGDPYDNYYGKPQNLQDPRADPYRRYDGRAQYFNPNIDPRYNTYNRYPVNPLMGQTVEVPINPTNEQLGSFFRQVISKLNIFYQPCLPGDPACLRQPLRFQNGSPLQSQQYGSSYGYDSRACITVYSKCYFQGNALQLCGHSTMIPKAQETMPILSIRAEQNFIMEFYMETDYRKNELFTLKGSQECLKYPLRIDQLLS